MEQFDIIIIGAGIAGCGLACNLRRAGYSGSVLIIDKNEVGFNSKERIIAADKFDAVTEYGFPVKHVFKGFRIGSINNVIATIPGKVYVTDYKAITGKLLEESQYPFRKEQAVHLEKKNVLITDKARYHYRFLADCSGVNSFVRTLYGFPKPFRYWIAVRKKLKKWPPFYDKNYYYNLMDSRNRYLDEFLFTGTHLDYCKWQNTDIRTIKRVVQDGKEGFITSIPGEGFIPKGDFFYFPGNPVFPLVHRNIAFLGDAFGNTPPQSAFGVDMILKTSKILANAILKENLRRYEKEWMSQYFKLYLKHLTLRIDRSNNPAYLDRLKKYPDIQKVCAVLKKYPREFMSLMQNHSEFDIPKELRKLYPARQLFFLAWHFLGVASRYTLMKISVKIQSFKN